MSVRVMHQPNTSGPLCRPEIAEIDVAVSLNLNRQISPFLSAGSSQIKAKEGLTQFWQALKAAKIELIEAGTLEDGTKQIIKILTLSASAFPGESAERKGRLLVRQCYEDWQTSCLPTSSKRAEYLF